MIRRPARFGLVLVLSLLGILALKTPSLYAQDAPVDNVDVVLIVDNSGSMRVNDPQGFRISAAKLFVDLAIDGDHIAIISMAGAEGTKVRKEFTRLSSILDYSSIGRQGLKDSLSDLRQLSGGGTYMGEALSLAYDLLEAQPSGNRQFVIFLTDGVQEVEAKARLDQAIAAFARRSPFWKIYAIALGDGADWDLLSDTLVPQTGGKAFRAQDPAELVNIYAEIFANLRYNFYAGHADVPAGRLVSLLTVAPDQLIKQVSIVIPRRHYVPRADLLLSPDGGNVVDPSEKVYHAEDPGYEIFTLNQKNSELNGAWQMRLQQQGASVVLLVQSELSIQLTAPPPADAWDELSLRYAPAGRVLFVQVTPRDLDPSLIERLTSRDLRGPSGKPKTGLAPHHVLTDGSLIELRDDGQGFDAVRDDGSYAGVTTSPLASGMYPARIDLTAAAGTLRMDKTRTFSVRPLPVQRLTIAADAEWQPGRAVDATIELEPGSDVTVEAFIPRLWVSEPDRNKYEVTLRQRDLRTFVAEVVPRLEGTYTLYAKGDISVVENGQTMRYVDVARVSSDAIRPRHVMVESRTASDLGELVSFDRLQLQFHLYSSSPEAEMLDLQVQGLISGTVLPAQVMLPPISDTDLTVSVRSPAQLPAGRGEFHVVMAPRRSSVTLSGREFAFTYSMGTTTPDKPPSRLPAFMVVSALVIMIGWFVRRRGRAALPIWRRSPDSLGRKR